MKPSGAAVAYTSSTIAVAGASTIAGLLMLRWLPVHDVGIWHSLLLFQSYTHLLRLGILNGLNRELPFLLGANDAPEAERVLRTTHFYTVLCAAAGFFLFAAAGAAARTATPLWSMGLLAFAVMTAAMFYVGYVEAVCRSSGRFADLARFQWLQAGLVVLQPVAIYAGGFGGLCAHGTTQAVITAAYGRAQCGVRLTPRFHWISARRLFATGLPLFAGNYVLTVGMGLDRLILLGSGGADAVGAYAAVLAVVGALGVIPGAITTFTYPTLSFRYGAAASLDDLWNATIRMTAAAVGVTAALAAAAWVVIPWVVPVILPAYAPVAGAMRLGAIAAVFMAAATCTTVLGTLKAWQWLFTYAATICGSRWVLGNVLASGDDPVAGMAKAITGAAAIGAAVALLAAFRATHPSPAPVRCQAAVS